MPPTHAKPLPHLSQPPQRCPGTPGPPGPLIAITGGISPDALSSAPAPAPTSLARRPSSGHGLRWPAWLPRADSRALQGPENARRFLKESSRLLPLSTPCLPRAGCWGEVPPGQERARRAAGPRSPGPEAAARSAARSQGPPFLARLAVPGTAGGQMHWT